MQVRATELCRVHYGLAPDIISNIFLKKDVKYDFRNYSLFAMRNDRSNHFGLEVISY